MLFNLTGRTIVIGGGHLKFIFEDQKGVDLVNFYEVCYRASSKDFIYSNGCGGLKRELTKLSNTEIICIFMDLIPDNPETIYVYNVLRKLRKEYTKMLVFPISCREYYYVKYLNTLHNMIVREDWVFTCLSKDGNYQKSDIIVTQQDKDFCKNFEKFCKLVAMKAPIDCAKNQSKYGRTFLYNDCLCDSNQNFCTINSLYQKSKEFVNQFECFPSIEQTNDSKELSWNEMVIMHRHLVDKYNDTREVFKSSNVKNLSKRAYYFY